MSSKLADIILFKDSEGYANIKGISDLKNNTIWTTQKEMAEFFQKHPSTISNHLKNIFNSKELTEREVTLNPKDKRIIVNPDSKKQPILYNLDAIISVGFRVHSNRAIRFRRWAIQIIREYIVKGFALDVESLKNNASLRLSNFANLEEQVQQIAEYRK